MLDLGIKLNIFDHKKNVQACFWFMLFNFMTPINAEIEITTARRKILAQKYCRKADPNSRTLQNVFRSLEKSGLLVQKEKNKQNIQSKREQVADSLQKYQLEILELENNSEVAGELGPLQYLSELTGVPINKIINYLLLVIIFVFDPLAI